MAKAKGKGKAKAEKPHYCKCGCGTEIPKTSTWVVGHNWRTKSGRAALLKGIKAMQERKKAEQKPTKPVKKETPKKKPKATEKAKLGKLGTQVLDDTLEQFEILKATPEG